MPGLGLGLGLRRRRKAGGAAVAGILDAYTGAAFAFASDVLIYSAHSVTDDAVGSQTEGDTGAFTVRVRRSSDNAVRSFTYSEVGDGTLLTWVGAGNDGFVQCGYDQGTGGDHFIEAAAGNQFRIVQSGVLQLQNGKAILKCVGSTTTLFTAYNPSSAAGVSTVFFIAQRHALNTYQGLFRSDSVADYYYLLEQGSGASAVHNNAIITNERHNGSSWTSSNRGIVWTQFANQSIFSNNTDFNFVGNGIRLGYSATVLAPDFQLLIIFPSEVSKPDIETILNNTYNIY